MKEWQRRGLAIAAGICALPGWCAQGAGGVTVYPVGPSIPQSLLRIELRLSRPLPRPLDPAAMKLLDARGAVIDGALLDLVLPDAQGREVTILMHPGRVKSGVGANLRLGRALHAGSRVTLLIDDPAIGPPLRKSWRVEAPQGASLDPSNWAIETPRVGTRQALRVRATATLGLAAETKIAVRAPDGARVGGRASFDEADNAWLFIPAAPWRAGAYALVTHPDLEDASGNRSCAPFETPLASERRCESGTQTAFDIPSLE